MKQIIEVIGLLLIGIAIGYMWAFQVYQPLKLAEENEQLKLDVRALSRAYTREFSKIFIEPGKR